jgi:predicted dithiol-disulfide oxidoreductase (DUF899 family)
MPDRHKIVSHDRWLHARKQFLRKEKALTRLRDRLSRERRNLPWERVDKPYVFEGADGKETLAQLFDGRRQLAVYHFMFAPDWDAGCPSCSFWADNFDDNIVHLAHRDVTMVAVSRAPYRKLVAYKKRMGWSFKWLSSSGTDFNFDYQASFRPDELAMNRALYNFKVQNPGVSEREGVSVFYKDARGAVFHTYSAYARGIDVLNTAYHYLDLVPKGRDEAGHAFPQFWVRRHDEYDGNVARERRASPRRPRRRGRRVVVPQRSRRGIRSRG